MPNQLGTAKIWDAQSGVLLFVLKDNNKTAASASFSPDGKKILTVSLDGTAKIQDARSGALLADLKEHHCEVTWTSFSPDGKKL